MTSCRVGLQACGGLSVRLCVVGLLACALPLLAQIPTVEESPASPHKVGMEIFRHADKTKALERIYSGDGTWTAESRWKGKTLLEVTR